MSNTTYERILADMPVGLERATLRVLSYRSGKVAAIGRGELVTELQKVLGDVQERQVRRCIHDLRRQGHLICSTPGEAGGYYLPKTMDEFQEFIDREIHPKALDLLETEKVMKEAARQLFGNASQPALLEMS